MLIKVLATDEFAQRFVETSLRIVGKKYTPTIVEMQCEGGPKTIGIYSVLGSQMLPKRRGRSRLTYSLYHPDHNRYGWSAEDLYGAGRKVRNQALRSSLQPPELTNCDLYLALNQDGGYSSYGIVADIMANCKAVESIHRGRGGEVVYNQFIGTGRVIVAPTDEFRTKRGNRVIEQLLGYRQPVVTYGTTDAANVFEFLQTLKAASILSLPAVFDNYENAHTIADYWQRVMQPSLNVLGLSFNPAHLGFDEHAKFGTQVVRGLVLREAMRMLGLVGSDLPDELTFAQWQRIGMQKVAELVMGDTLEKPVEFSLHTTESLLAHAPYWQRPLRDYAIELQERAGHPVVALHRPWGQPIRTDERLTLPNMTVAQTHEQGYWLSGAGIYWGQYALGEFGNIIFTVKDTTAGGVHRLAEPYLRGNSKLYLMPVGLFRICAEGQREDDSIDPWVFLTITSGWSEEKRQERLRQLWDAMEVPLPVANIGTKTVVRVNLDDITITRQKTG